MSSPPFTIIQGKEGASPKRPLFLVTITAPDGDVCYLTSAAYYGAAGITWPSTMPNNQYLARILGNELTAIQAIGPQGFDTVPGFSLTLADADKFLWTNHCIPHGWRGSTVVLTVILWDVVANAYSTDAYAWTFIGGNPQHNYANGQTTLDVTSATNFSRLKIPSVAIQYRCPWDFPATADQRAAALNDPSSPYYQCGYSPDQAGGIGNYATGTTPFTACDFTRSSPSDPSVGCMARLGNAATTSVAPDGDLTHDKAGNYTGRFGGVTWLAPSQYSGRQYVSGQKTFGFNQPNGAIAGAYYNWVYGTQWVAGHVLAPAGEPNSLRSEVAVCVAAYGPVTIQQVVVNGVSVPQNNSDPLFTWRFAAPNGVGSGAILSQITGAGGRSGALNFDAIFNGHGDPHGSVATIEFVVPAELAQPGSVPSVQVLVTSGPLLNVYAINSITGGVATFTGPNFSCAGNAPFKVIIVGNSNSALNGVWGLTSWTYGPPGTVTLDGTTASGSGGGMFFFTGPDLNDNGGSGPAANLAFAALDLMTWGNISLAQIDPASWYNAAQVCRNAVTYTAADGTSQTHAQFKASFALTSRQTLAQVLTAVRNAGNLMIAPNSITGLIQAFVKETLADQQPSPIPGSNYNTAVPSLTAGSASANGYFAYFFDETVIEEGSFRVTATRIESTPNTVAISFQDEYNGYQQDSLNEIDDNAYAYSGNQEIAVPIPITGAPNFDQCSRVANAQLAEALYGNPRNDAGGTTYFEFRTNHRVLHLASRLGYICGLSWQGDYGSPTAPQPIRLLSIKPDMDGEHWDIKAAWHNDEWYTYAYGQNPAPFQNNPLQSPTRPPFPWRPGIPTWSSSDALFPSLDSFNLTVNLTAYPAQVAISGNVPPNTQQKTKPPLVPLQATVASTGGTLVSGTYCIQFSTNGQNGPVSNIVTAVIPSGVTAGSITVSGIRWQSGAAPSIQPFIGTSSMNMRETTSYTGSSPDGDGNPTVFTFTAFPVDGLGLPDVNLAEFLVEEIPLIHGGVWGDTIASVAGNVLTFLDGAWGSNQWAGYILSLDFRAGVDVIPGLSILVSSSTPNTLTMAAAGFLAGDVVVLRAQAAIITANSIGDPNFINSNNDGTGFDVDAEVGNQVMIIAGTGAGQSPKSIASNTSTVLTINGTWDEMPDSTSVYIVIAQTVLYSYTTGTFVGTGATLPIATVTALTTQSLQLLIRVSTCDASGKSAPSRYQPFREVFIPPFAAPTIYVNSSQALPVGPLNVVAYASGGPITLTLAPFLQWVSQTVSIVKEDSSSNAVAWQTNSAADTVYGYGTTGSLTTQGAVVEITATSA